MLPEFEYIETPRLLLRKITPEVYAPVLAQLNDEQLSEFTGFSRAEDIAKERARAAGGLSSYALTFVYFHILDKDTKKNIGSIGYYRIYPEHDRGEIGYALYDEADRRKGYMKELMPVVLDYGFNTLNLHRVEAMVSPGNVPSLRLLEIFNFKYEGHMRQHYKREDSLVFGLLKPEYLIQNA